MGLTSLILLNIHMKQIETHTEVLKSFQSTAEVTDYLISLGKSVHSDLSLQNNRSCFIRRCRSNVWVKATNNNGVVDVKVSSPSVYTLGIIKVLLDCVQQQPVEKVKKLQMADFKEFVQYLPLERQKGFQLFINLIKQQIS